MRKQFQPRYKIANKRTVLIIFCFKPLGLNVLHGRKYNMKLETPALEIQQSFNQKVENVHEPISIVLKC